MFSPWLVTVITALGTTAPEGSVTAPRIVPKVDCACPNGARHTATTAMLNATAKGLSFIASLPPQVGAMSAVFPRKPVSWRIARSIFHKCVDSQDQKNDPKNGLPPSDVNWHSLWK